ncbi:uncharacterized protein VP01_10985g1, partial [Puccinia sorghi]
PTLAQPYQQLALSCDSSSPWNQTVASFMSDISDDAHSTAETASVIMDKLNTTILKTAIEAIPLLTQDNYMLWKNR